MRNNYQFRLCDFPFYFRALFLIGLISCLSIHNASATEQVGVSLLATSVNEVKSYPADVDDNGLLILLIADICDITFETGSGLEGLLPDAICEQIQMNSIVPSLKNDEVDQGMPSGVEAVTKTIYTGDYNPPSPPKKEWWEKVLSNLTAPVIVLLLSILLLINYFVWKKVTSKLKLQDLSPTSARNYLNTFNHFGVHSFVRCIFLVPIWPALVAIILWYKKKYLPLIRAVGCKCPKCNAYKLEKLYEDLGDTDLLTDSEHVEFQLHTVKFCFYKCEACGEIIKDRLPIKTGCKVCPTCHNYTLVAKNGPYIIDYATTKSAGLEEAKYECAFCGARYIVRTIMPKIAMSSMSSSSLSHKSSDSSSDGGSGSGSISGSSGFDGK